jgi:hypothetical protein
MPPKCRLTFNGLHGVISQKMVLLHNRRCENLKSYITNQFLTNISKSMRRKENGGLSRRYITHIFDTWVPTLRPLFPIFSSFVSPLHLFLSLSLSVHRTLLFVDSDCKRKLLQLF